MKVLKLTFLLFCFSSINTSAKLDGSSCLNSKFDIEISHKTFFFGLVKKKLKLKKNICLLDIIHEKAPLVEEKWTIDVCRGPVHIKKGFSSLKVIKRSKSECPDSGDYCKEVESITSAIQDSGLIFAEGDRDTISSDHGKVFCSYLLVQRYLLEGHIFILNDVNVNLFKKRIQRKKSENKTVEKLEKSDSFSGSF